VEQTRPGRKPVEQMSSSQQPDLLRRRWNKVKKVASKLMSEALPSSINKCTRLRTECQSHLLGKQPQLDPYERATMDPAEVERRHRDREQALRKALEVFEDCLEGYRRLEDRVYDILVRQEKGRNIEGQLRLSWQAKAHKKTLEDVDKEKKTPRQDRRRPAVAGPPQGRRLGESGARPLLGAPHADPPLCV